jgi:hypothetical protein
MLVIVSYLLTNLLAPVLSQKTHIFLLVKKENIAKVPHSTKPSIVGAIDGSDC